MFQAYTDTETVEAPATGFFAPAKFASLPAVRRLSGAEARAFLQERELPLHPVILTDVMAGTPALSKWTPELFRTRYPKLTKQVAGRPVTLAEQLDHIVTSTEEHPAPYPFNISITQELPELMKDLEPFVRFGRSDRTMNPLMPSFLLNGTIVHELFFGGRGACYPWLHYDLLGMHTQMTQILGEKEFIFYDPSQTPLLYPHEANPRLSQVGNIFAPDLERFPLFEEARAFSLTLYEGETLFFPSGWWHVTRMTGPCISYGRAVVNASNWDQMMDENLIHWSKARPRSARAAYLFGKALGRTFSAMESLN